MLREPFPQYFNDKLRARFLKHHFGRYHASQINIVLTHGFFLALDPEEYKIGKPNPPLGPLYLASYLRQQNFKVRFYDTTFKRGHWQFRNDLRSFPAEIVGFYTIISTRKNIVNMIEDCRVESLITIVGGPDASSDPQYYIEKGADLVIVGEGEETLVEVLKEFQKPSKNFFQIPGVYTGKQYPFTPRAHIQDIDSVPFPARDIVNFVPYFEMWDRKGSDKTAISLITSRGCPFSCSWCSKPVFGSSLRQRSPQNVVQEITQIIDALHITRFKFADDIFPIDKTWLERFHTEIKHLNKKISFECLLRVDKADLATLLLLKDSGCNRVFFGAESGSNRVLHRMNKKIHPLQIVEATKLAHKARIEVGFFLMLGYPGENIEDIEHTRKLVRTASPDYCAIKIAQPIKGTRFYEDVLKHYSTKKRIVDKSPVVYQPPYPKIVYWLVQRIINYETLMNKATEIRLYSKIIYACYLIAYKLLKLFVS